MYAKHFMTGLNSAYVICLFQQC